MNVILNGILKLNTKIVSKKIKKLKINANAKKCNEREICAIWKTIEAISSRLTSDSETYMVVADRQSALRAFASVWCK